MLLVMKPLLKPDCIVLLDETARAKEQEIIACWPDQLGTSYWIEGVEKPFAVICVSGKG
jgi:hypothetical protein